MRFKFPEKTDGIWFAWRPVWTENGSIVWLGRVYRKWNKTMYQDIGGYFPGWEYHIIHNTK